MTEIGSLKWIEVLLLVLAGVGFYIWQMRDLRKAREASRQAAQKAAELNPPTAQPPLPPTPTQAKTQTEPAPPQGQPNPPP